jgi:integrase
LKAVDTMTSDKRKEAAIADWVFPGRKGINQLSGMAMLMLLRRMKRDDITVHGFRSTFRDWTAEQTHYPYEVAEGALAHTIGNRVTTAYLRSDLFEKRRKLMEAWARYCHTPSRKDEGSGNVVTLMGR